MELVQLKYFKVMAEQPNMSQAAKMLHVSQPTLSASLAKLEAELGVSLFERSKGKLILNQEGRAFLKRTNRVLEELDRAEKEIKGVRGKSTLPVYVLTTVPHICSSVAAAFQMRNPDIVLRFDVADQSIVAEKAIEHQADFVISEKLDSSKFDWLPLLEEEYAYYIASENPLAKEESLLSIDRLADKPRIYYRDSLDCQPAISELRHIIAATNDIYFALRMVGMDTACARLPRLHAEECLRAHPDLRATCVPTLGGQISNTVGISRMKGIGLPVQAQMAYEFFKERLSSGGQSNMVDMII